MNVVADPMPGRCQYFGSSRIGIMNCDILFLDALLPQSLLVIVLKFLVNLGASRGVVAVYDGLMPLC